MSKLHRKSYGNGVNARFFRKIRISQSKILTSLSVHSLQKSNKNSQQTGEVLDETGFYLTNILWEKSCTLVKVITDKREKRWCFEKRYTNAQALNYRKYKCEVNGKGRMSESMNSTEIRKNFGNTIHWILVSCTSRWHRYRQRTIFVVAKDNAISK